MSSADQTDASEVQSEILREARRTTHAVRAIAQTRNGKDLGQIFWVKLNSVKVAAERCQVANLKRKNFLVMSMGS